MATRFLEARAAPCYIVIASATKGVVIQKDLSGGLYMSADDFIVHTNHDLQPENEFETKATQTNKTTILGMEALLEESEDRMHCIQSKWDSWLRKRNQALRARGELETVPMIREATLLRWVKAYPIMNECTQFGCILDPGTGTIRWLERGQDGEVET